MRTTLSARPEVQYPESDGRPMAETDLHRDMLLALIYSLQQFFAGDEEVYVGGNVFLYYEQGEPDASCAPDVFLVKGIGNYRRRTYRLWEEGKAPDLVIELTSRSTKLQDVGLKKGLYEALGVTEYYVFDPLNEYLRPPFVGFRLEEGGYVQMEPSGGRLRSDVTGLELGPLAGWLRFFDPATGQPLLTPEETGQAMKEAEENARLEREAREAAEEQNARLEAELEQLRSAAKRQKP